MTTSCYLPVIYYWLRPFPVAVRFLKFSFKELSGLFYCLIVNVLCADFLCRATFISYHAFNSLSTVFLLFKVVCSTLFRFHATAFICYHICHAFVNMFLYLFLTLLKSLPDSLATALI